MKLRSCRKWFDAIEKGTKTVEGRLTNYDLKEGEKITFVCGTKQTTKRIRFIHQYQNFKQMLLAEGIQNVLPNVSTLQQGELIFKDWYSDELQMKKGVMAIGLEA